MSGFRLIKSERLRFRRPARLENMYVLSPFVWADEAGFHLMLRAVPRRDDEPRLKMAEAWYGRGGDGLSFTMDEGPAIFPGPQAEDLDGCEDPTVVCQGGAVHAWYTGWNHKQQTGRLLHAVGSSVETLKKTGVAIDSTADFTNPKEATLGRGADGDWRLFFEYAADGASKIGIARASTLDGPWPPQVSPLERREDQWDSWHMSSGPVIDQASGSPVMFYNGATKDAHWRIGWARFDADFGRILERELEPLITPGDHDAAASDIAFAASAVERGEHVWVYYSISDQDVRRATLLRL